MSFTAIGIAELTLAHIEELCVEAAPEGETIEYKRALPADGNDRWVARTTLVERSRNKLLEEVIAFANAHGGRVIIGLEETDDEPPRAGRIVPLPSCHELASRIAHAARDVISPQIPLLNVRGMSLDGQADGCVVIDVHESPLAPHRLEATGQCFVRRADRTEKMTMREIQDLTVDRLRGTERVTARLRHLVDGLSLSAEDRFRLQIVATPTTARMNIPWNIDPAAIVPELRVFSSHAGRFQHKVPVGVLSPSQPILRGWRWEDRRDDPMLSFHVYWDGSVVAEFQVSERNNQQSLFPSWIVALAAQALDEVDKVRTVAERPDAEYAIQFRLLTGHRLHLLKYGANMPGLGTAGVLPSRLQPPVYSGTTRDSFVRVIDELQRDLYNAVGVAADDIGVEL